MVHIGCGADVIRQRRRNDQQRKEDEANGIYYVPKDWKPAKNKKYPHYTPLRNANIFNERQKLSFIRKRALFNLQKQNSSTSSSSSESHNKRDHLRAKRAASFSSQPPLSRPLARQSSTSSAPAHLRASNSCSPSNSERSSSSLSSSNSSKEPLLFCPPNGSRRKSLLLIGRQTAVINEEETECDEIEQASSVLQWHIVPHCRKPGLFWKSSSSSSEHSEAQFEALRPLSLLKTTHTLVAEVHEQHFNDDEEDDPCAVLDNDLSLFMELSPMTSKGRWASIEDDLDIMCDKMVKL